MKSFGKAFFCMAALWAAVPAVSQAPVSVRVRLEPLPGARQLPDNAADQVETVLKNRANSLGVPDSHVAISGSIVTVTIAGPTATWADRRRQLNQIVKNVRLEFIWLKDVRTGSGSSVAGNRKGSFIYESANSIRDARTGRTLTPTQIQRKVLYADPKCLIVSGADLKPNGAQVDLRGGGSSTRVVTRLQFNDAGTRRFADFTRTHIGALLAIVLNGQIQSAPRIKDAIMDGAAVIEGNAQTVQEAQSLANYLNAGALPCRLAPMPGS